MIHVKEECCNSCGQKITEKRAIEILRIQKIQERQDEQMESVINITDHLAQNEGVKELEDFAYTLECFLLCRDNTREDLQTILSGISEDVKERHKGELEQIRKWKNLVKKLPNQMYRDLEGMVENLQENLDKIINTCD